MAFIPRSSFTYPTRTPSWYAGHMARSMREMGALLNDIDLVIEARDARLPLTSINGVFDGMMDKAWGDRSSMLAESSADALRNAGPLLGSRLQQDTWRVDKKGKMREKLVVYTKRDLAEQQYERPLIKAFKTHLGQKVMFADTRVDHDVREILNHAVNMMKKQGSMERMYILVVGMPNVGKSSLLNALRRVGVRKGKHFVTGAMAGVTRRIGGTVKIHEEPNVYVYDTPGVMVPFLGHGEAGAERGIKYALTGGIKEDLFELDAVIDYLLWRMNQRLVTDRLVPPSAQNPSYLTSLPLPPDFSPTDDLYTLLDALCQRIGALRKGGEKDYETGMTFIHHAFRDGKLGRWTFDELEGRMSQLAASSAGETPISASLDTRVSLAVKEYLDMMNKQKEELEQGKGLSASATRKKEKAEQNEKRLEKLKARREAKGITEKPVSSKSKYGSKSKSQARKVFVRAVARGKSVRR